MYEITFKNENKYTGKYGPVTFIEGKTTTNDKWIASWFESKENFKVTSNKKSKDTEGDSEQEEDFNALTVEQLKAIAKVKGIEGISKLKKEELIEVLEGGE